MFSTRQKVVAWFIVALIVAWLLSVTLRPGRQLSGINLAPFSQKWPALVCVLTQCPENRISRILLFVDLLGNIVVFVPFGVALAVALAPGRTTGGPMRPHLKRDWWLKIVAAGGLLSLGIELAQLTLPTRATDVDDVILNTLGTAIGALLVVAFSEGGLGIRD